MFTGLIEDIGTIAASAAQGDGLRLSISCAIPPEEIATGDSIAVDGVCLTVTGFFRSGITMDVSPESIKRTTLGRKKAGGRVNLERALRLSDRLGGHLVSGHIDDMAAVSSIVRSGSFIQMDFTAPENILKYIIEKGSVAIDGISLTVNGCSSRGFHVMIIPQTISGTTLQDRKTGDAVNIETDLIGKYVEKLCGGSRETKEPITRETLEKYGFI